MTVQIKFCGLSTPETVEAAIDLGADYIGLVHFPISPRHVTLSHARKLRDQAHGRIKTVLLLVNAQPDELIAALKAVQPDIIQFHGGETPQWVGAVRENAKIEAWKAFGLRDQASLTNSTSFKNSVDRILFDSPAKALPGGTGTRFNWSLLAGHRHIMPWGLAGGLDPSSVADAIAETGAPLVDVSSGIESAPGVKDMDKMAAFVKAARP
jgi:phosphoribosylanthranilate isomerase